MDRKWGPLPRMKALKPIKIGKPQDRERGGVGNPKCSEAGNENKTNQEDR